ncbi:MAG TPA: transcriptional regulator [Longimicrobium sp.]|nr:transcriptional regulator [Longimicrobium sp.]
MPEPELAGGLDERIHARLRLGVMSLLAGVEEAEFTHIRDRLGATDGNLGSHLRKLEEAGFVAVRRELEGRGAVTRYRLTPAGRAAFREYVDQLAALLGLEGPAPGSGSSP